MRRIIKRTLSLVLMVCMILSMLATFTLAADREYAAKVYINGMQVDFENAPYAMGNEIFVPLEEACRYMNIPFTKEGIAYTLSHGKESITIEEGNMIAVKGEETVTLADQTWTKGGIVYAPTDLFKTGLQMDVTADIESRRAYFNPGVYKIYVTEENAAMVDLDVPDKDLLATGTSGTDNIIYNESILSTVEKSVYYKFDLSQFTGKSISDARIFAYCGMYNNLDPYLGAIRTEVWEKGMTYSTAPKNYEGATIVRDSNRLLSSTHKQGGKNFILHSVNVTAWANDALTKGEQLSVKMLGIPALTKYTQPQVMIKGVKTSQRPYISITTNEEFNFPVAQATKETDIDRNTFEKLKFLTKLGIFQEGEEFPADLSTSVTRREFTAYAIRLMNNPVFDENAEQIFSDVAPKTACYGEIMESAKLGLISSAPQMSFRPDENITYNEALTIIGRMLGYGTYADQNGGFAQGFVSAAVKNDLIEGVKNHDGNIGFDSMFNLFFNALEAPMFETSVIKSNGESEYVFDENTTLLSIYWDLLKIEGRVEANEYSNLDPSLPAASGKLVIEGTGYNNQNPDYNVLLGYKVTGYCDKDSNILYLGADKYKNKTETIHIDDIIGSVNDANGFTFTYESGNGKNKSDRVNKTDTVIYNGKTVFPSEINKNLIGKDTGSITYLNDTTVIITAYTTLVVYDVDEDEEVITDKYAPYDNTLRLKGTDYYTFRDENGDPVEITNLAKNDVISAAVSLDKKVIICEISKVKLIGKISAKTDDGELEINGNLYETVGENQLWLNDLKLGAEGTMFIDSFGYIAGFETAQAKSGMMGYVLTHAYKGGGISPRLQLGLITTEDQEMVGYNLADSVIIDGVKLKTDGEILTALGKTDGAADVTKQGIVFSTNANREIIKIDTPYFNEEKENTDSSLHIRFTGTSSNKLHYKAAAGRLGDLFYWDRTSALNVMVPTDEADVESYQYFRTGLTNDKKYQAEVYSIGKKHPKADIVVFRGTSTATSVSGDIAIAGRQVMTLNEEGYYVGKLYYYTASPTPSSVIIPDDFYSNPEISTANKDTLSDIHPGDIIRIGKDFNGELVAITRYYNYETQLFETFANADNFNADPRIYGGYITSKYNSYVRFTSDKSLLDDPEAYENATEDKFRWVDLEMNSGTNKKVYKYEVEQRNVIVEKATAADATDFEHVPYAPTGIILQTTYAQTIDAAYLLNVGKPENTGIYKVNFIPGENATGTALTYQKDIGDTFALPECRFLHNDPAYAFDFWSCGDQNYLAGETVTVTGDMTFTANWKWVGIQYDVIYDGNGADSGAVPTERAIGGSTYTLAANPGDTGYKKAEFDFIGWEYDGITYQSGDSFTMPERPVTFKAVWEPKIMQPAGEGTTASPYLITTPKELKWFANHVNAGNAAVNAKMMSDINMKSENWYSFRIKDFAGTFDGNGKAIRNFKIEGGQNIALFQGISGGTVKDLTITNAEVISTYTVTSMTSGTAILASVMTGGSITNVRTSGTIKTASEGYANGSGSIVGHLKGGNLENCISDVVIDLSAGGTSTIDYSYTNGTNYGVGGIVGLWEPLTTSKITNCGFEGRINAPYSSRVGGVVGCIKKNSKFTLDRCYNTGNITGFRQVAGILGWVNNGKDFADGLNNMYNTGNIVAKTATNSYASGIASGLRGAYATKQFYSTGDVTVDDGDNTTPEFNNTCGLLLTARDGSAYQNSIRGTYLETYTYGTDNTPKHPYAVAGTVYTTGTYMKGCTEAELKADAILDRLGRDIFAIDPTKNNGLPIFKWQQ